MPYLLDMLYVFTPLSLVLLLSQLGLGGRLQVTLLVLLVLASMYPIYALVVALTGLVARRRSGTSSEAVRALPRREAWALWLSSPLVAAYCLVIDLLRKYVTPLFYHQPVDLMLLEPRHCPVPAGDPEQGAIEAVRR